MPETLLGPSTILLYGREMVDLVFQYQDPRPGAAIAPQQITTLSAAQTYTGGAAQAAPLPVPGNVAPRPVRLSNNEFLELQLAHPDARLARIYGFAYEGHYFDLASPAIFLVHGPGDEPDENPPGNRVARAPHTTDRTGATRTSSSFSEDMRVWPYDKGDFSIRLDVETGPLAQILLDAELMSEEVLATVSGAHARVSGAHARVSGAHARVSGAHARIRGNRGGD
jgi:hypothetical protein